MRRCVFINGCSRLWLNWSIVILVHSWIVLLTIHTAQGKYKKKNFWHKMNEVVGHWEETSCHKGNLALPNAGHFEMPPWAVLWTSLFIIPAFYCRICWFLLRHVAKSFFFVRKFVQLWSDQTTSKLKIYLRFHWASCDFLYKKGMSWKKDKIALKDYIVHILLYNTNCSGGRIVCWALVAVVHFWCFFMKMLLCP